MKIAPVAAALFLLMSAATTPHAFAATTGTTSEQQAVARRTEAAVPTPAPQDPSHKHQVAEAANRAMCMDKISSLEETLAERQGANGYEEAVSLRDEGIRLCEQGEYEAAMERLNEAMVAAGGLD